MTISSCGILSVSNLAMRPLPSAILLAMTRHSTCVELGEILVGVRSHSQTLARLGLANVVKEIVRIFGVGSSMARVPSGRSRNLVCVPATVSIASSNGSATDV